MKSRRLRNYRISKIRRGKIKSIGFFEGLRLKSIGCADGKRALPREDGSGRWISPFIDKEIHSYGVFSDRMWGSLQLENEQSYARLGELTDLIERLRLQLKKTYLELEEAIEIENSIPNNLRKHGEDQLSEKQVIARREREKSKRLQVFKDGITALETSLSDGEKEFSKTFNKIIEDNHSTRIICDKMKNRIIQRMDIYWSSALRRHTDARRMPPIPDVEVTSDAEQIYMLAHEEQLNNQI